MKLYFLGGAAEVGASCTLIEMEGHRILVDAGIRMGASPGSVLPNFSVLDDVGPPEEILVTHAHTDHTGALPVLVGNVPGDVMIRCTPATQAITRVLLTDALKIMDLKGEKEGDLPLYPPEAVDACLARMTHVPNLSTVPICNGDLRATWIPAGHILGAASIYIEGKQESLLMTGDVSVANQQTIPGMVIPQCKPDVVVMESTYGNRQHADRSQQESALAHRVAEVVESEGKVLIPAFAVGRAQEVVLILSRAMRQGQIPSFPVFVDGMVRSVNAVYAAFPDDLAPPVRRRVMKGEDPFYSEWVGAVSVPADRERVLAGPPCCIVASSGMLIGGASSYYAERMAGDENNLIAITGYQDEESPGRALLDLAQANEESKRELTLNGNRTSVACRVETYSLSAHADRGELTSLVHRLSPRSVFLVHGDDDARAALASGLDIHLANGVQLPDNGGVYSVEPREKTSGRRRYGRSVPRYGIEGGRELGDEALKEVREYLLETDAKGAFRVQDLAEIWFGSEDTEISDLEAFKMLLDSDTVHFEVDRRRPYLYFVSEVKAERSGPIEMNDARVRIQKEFPPESGLFKCSAFVEEGVYELAFHFPDVARNVYGEQISMLEKETGWQLRLRETPHQERLFDVARTAAPAGATVLKPPALRLDQRQVSITVDVPGNLESEWTELSKAAVQKFKDDTGFHLEIVRPEIRSSRSASKTPSGAWEINKAYASIRNAFQNESQSPYKVGLKSDAIEVAFISPSVGNRYEDLLEKISGETGWPIQIRSSANQDQISQIARRTTPESCLVRGTPKIFTGEERVCVPVVHLPDAGQTADLKEAFKEETGFEILWEEPKE